MIDWCPEDTDSQLASRCAQDVSSEHYTFLQDLPVKSNVSGIVYVNIFCAQCHKDDHHLKHMKTDIVCNLTDFTQMTPADYRTLLALMDYHPGHLQWTTKLTHQPVTSYFNITDLDKYRDETVKCTLYLGVKGQSCQAAVTTCAEDWPDDDIRQACTSYTYHMYSDDKIYRNYDCALCNHVLPGDLHCSPPIDDIQALTCKFPSLFDLFTVYEECDEPLVWNPLTQKCENFITFCITEDYNRNQSVLYPNLTLYLEETQMTYSFGQYEFINEDFVRVCHRSLDRVSVLSLVSTVLMLVSLVCMFLHMCIFFVQFKRRSVPRWTQFFMVCSLFIAELLFLVGYSAQGNYVPCVIFSCLTYCFFTVAFFWMNVISFDTCRAFYSHTRFRATTKTLIYYIIYATGLPLVMSAVALVVNQLSPATFPLSPAFGTGRCWFNNKWGLVMFFISPVILILISNICLYVVSIYEIFVQQKAARFAAQSAIRGRKVPRSRTEANKGQNGNTSREDVTAEPTAKERGPQERARDSPGHSEGLQERARQLKVLLDRLAIYSKVALIMGLTWVFALISLFVDSITVMYLHVVFNSLQGTLIFIAFNCTKENYRKLRDTISGSASRNTEDTFA